MRGIPKTKETLRIGHRRPENSLGQKADPALCPFREGGLSRTLCLSGRFQENQGMELSEMSSEMQTGHLNYQVKGF